MNKKPHSFIDRSLEAVRQSVLASVRTRYFPELWYILENWFLLLKGRRVLAVGHGFGLVAEALAKSGWDVTVVDPSLSALTELKERFSKAGLTGAFQQAEPDALPFANGAFSAVASLNTLELARNPLHATHEISRVLAPGGRAVIATFNKLGPWSISAVMRVMRPADDRRASHCVTKGELKRMVKATDLTLDDIKDRAQYLPFGSKSMKIPITGAFVALLAKPERSSPPKGGDSSPRPRSRPSMSRRSPQQTKKTT